MNKKRLTLAFVSLFAATALLAGCSSKEGEADKEIDRMQLSGIPTAYQVGDTINWSAATVKVTYKDKSTATFTGSQVEYDVSETAEATKVVVYTTGLHAQTTLVEGEYDIKAALAGKLENKYSMGRIVVGKITSDKYDLDSFEVPQFVQDLKVIKEGQSQEGSFADVSEDFTVGTKNVFKFVPRASFTLKGQGGQAKRYTNYEKDFSLKEITGPSTKVDADVDDYAIVADGSGIKFAETAVGKKFEITVQPKEFSTDANGKTASVSFSFKVKSGLNIYEAKQLGALNLHSYSLKDLNGTEKIVSHIGRNTDAYGESEAGSKPHYFNANISTHGSDKVFWDDVRGDYSYVDYKGIWTDFLKLRTENGVQKGIFTEEEIAEYTDIKGVYFQNRITLTKEDIPEDYFITADESGNLSHYPAFTYLRDASEVYTPIVKNNDVEINGNFFMLDNQLPICASNWGDKLNPGFHTYGNGITGPDGTIDPGHCSLFKFCGYDPDISEVYHYNNVDVLGGKKGIVRNLNTKGVVTELEGEDAILGVTAMIAMKNKYCAGEYVNNIIKQYQIGIFPDINLAGVNTAELNGETIHYNTLIDKCNIFDCTNTAICNYHNAGTLVRNSRFGRFGGAAILNAGDVDEKGDEINYDYAKKLKANVPELAGIDTTAEPDPFQDLYKSNTYIDAASTASFNNYVTGNETYFVAVHASGYFDKTLPTYQDMFAVINNAYRFEENGHQVYNIKSLNMDGHDYVMSKNRFWCGDVVLNADTNKPLKAGCIDDTNAAFTWYSNLATYGLPIFYTEEGDIFTSFYDPEKTAEEQPGVPKMFFTPASVAAFFMGGMSNPSVLVPQGHITAKSVSVLLPAGKTTLNAVFELREVAAE